MGETSRIKVLFLCTGNSCRSQMAEGFARALKSDAIEAYSAGTATHGLDPLAVEVMGEAGVDISNHQAKCLDELKDVQFDLVVTVCDNAAASCPTFPGLARVVHVPFDDPPAMPWADENDRLANYRRVRDDIRRFVLTLGEGLD